MSVSDQHLVAQTLLLRLHSSAKTAPRRKGRLTFIATPSPLCYETDLSARTSDDFSDRLQTAAQELLASMELRKSASQLTALPSELMLHVISFVEPDDLLALVQTCDGIKRFIKIHAKQITNTFLETMFPKEWKFLQVFPLCGWLSPQHKRFCHVDRGACDYIRMSLFRSSDVRGKDATSNLSLASRKDVQLSGMVAQPGPQLLYYMLNYGHLIQRELSRSNNLGSGSKPARKNHTLFARSLRLWTDYTFQHSDTRMEIRERNVDVFDGYKEYAEVQRNYAEVLEVKNVWADLNRPRSLMWYFGISGTENRRGDEGREEEVMVETMIEVLRRRIEALSL